MHFDGDAAAIVLDRDRSVGVDGDLICLAWPAIASSIELSTTSYTR